jgi:hypothetical protein
MDRRENLKVILTGSLATGFLLSTGCTSETNAGDKVKNTQQGYGRTPEEMLHDQKLRSETFFTQKEQKMISTLCDIIIPKDDQSGSATEAGVPEFIEFMVKDYPAFQTPMRGGLMWLENQCFSLFDRSFMDLTDAEKMTIIEQIAYPDQSESSMAFGVTFFNLLRNLTCTGFYTSEMGIKDLGYVGNRANQWDGVPKDVLEKYGLEYDKRTLEICLKIEDQQKIAVWDDEGKLIG